MIFVQNKLVLVQLPEKIQVNNHSDYFLYLFDFLNVLKQIGITNIVKIERNKVLRDQKLINENISFQYLIAQESDFYTMNTVHSLLSIVKSSTGALAILGKNDITKELFLICCILMKQYAMQARHALGYLSLFCFQNFTPLLVQSILINEQNI